MNKEIKKYGDIAVDVWGDFALFAPPEASTEHVSYPVPTPSAMRGVLNSIYAKPTEFYYQITAIEIIRLGSTIPIMKNEVKSKINIRLEPIDVSKQRTQRNYVYLKNVYYRIHADMIMQDQKEARVTHISVINQFNKRVRKGKCFSQPFLGTRECMAFFATPNPEKRAIQVSQSYGLMLYDVFDIRNNIPLNTDKKGYQDTTNVTFYNCQMNNGLILIPPIESEEVYKIV